MKIIALESWDMISLICMAVVFIGPLIKEFRSIQWIYWSVGLSEAKYDSTISALNDKYLRKFLRVISVESEVGVVSHGADRRY